MYTTNISTEMSFSPQDDDALTVNFSGHNLGNSSPMGKQALSGDASPLEKSPKSANTQKAQLSLTSKKIRKDDKMMEATREFNKLLTLEERLHILHLHDSHGLSDGKIAQITGVKYQTVRIIVLTWQKTGRVNKLLTYAAKKKILLNRREKLHVPKKSPSLLNKASPGINIHISSVSDGLEGKDTLCLRPVARPDQKLAPEWSDFTSLDQQVEKCVYEYAMPR